jgi:aminopeptidase
MPLEKRAMDLAKIIVDYSTEINSKDRVLIQAEDSFYEFASYLGKTARAKGAEVIFDYRNLKERRKLINDNNKKELNGLSGRLCEMAEWCTARIMVDAWTNPLYLKGIDPKKIADFNEMVGKPFLDRIAGDGKRFKGVKWNITGYPTEAMAKNAGMSYERYKDFVFSATNINWYKVRDQMKNIKKIFDNANTVHIFHEPHTDLHLSLKGRGGDLCAGNFNMPDGEVYYGPVENSAEGKVYFPYVSIRDGNEVEGIQLVYHKGKIESFSAKRNQKFLKAMLDLDGVKRLGEFGIGCNYGIWKYTKNLLFDEKIGGTIHLALGEAYKRPLNDGGGKNHGKIHWDLVCELRKLNGFRGGEIYVNDELVQKNGKWVFDDA